MAKFSGSESIGPENAVSALSAAEAVPSRTAITSENTEFSAITVLEGVWRRERHSKRQVAMSCTYVWPLDLPKGTVSQSA